MTKKPTPSAAVQRLPIPVETVARRIYLIRGQKVMLDSDLAELYRVETSALNRAVKRNLERFPDDFMFQLTEEESESLTFQLGISKAGRGGRRYLPYMFTEQGVAMLSSVLTSTRAVQVNIAIMRAFVQLREALAGHKDLARKLQDMKRTQNQHGAHINAIWKAIQKLIEEPEKPKRSIGFKTGRTEERKMSLKTEADQ